MSVEVIGGGPAGLRTAKLLSENDFDVSLYEAGEIGGQIRCGEAYLDVYSIKRPKHGLLFEYDEVYHIVNGEKVAINGSHMYQYDKEEMLKGMRDEAEDTGAEIVEEKTIHSVDDETLTVDASGFPSLMYSKEDYETGFAVSHIVGEEVNQMLFEWKGNGYYWKFPKKGESNVGYTRFDGFGTVWEKSKKYAESVGNIRDSSGGYVPFNLFRSLWLPEKRTVLVGDAAGLANAFHEGGIHTALLSAEVAAECIVEGDLQEYEDRLSRLVEAEGKSAEVANEFLNMGCLGDLLRMGGTIRDFTDPSLLRKARVGAKYLKNKLTRV